MAREEGGGGILEWCQGNRDLRVRDEELKLEWDG